MAFILYILHLMLLHKTFHTMFSCLFILLQFRMWAHEWNLGHGCISIYSVVDFKSLVCLCYQGNVFYSALGCILLIFSLLLSGCSRLSDMSHILRNMDAFRYSSCRIARFHQLLVIEVVRPLYIYACNSEGNRQQNTHICSG